MKEYEGCGVSVTELLKTAGLAKSTYFYKNKHGKPGRKASARTLKKDGTTVSNSEVVENIVKILDHPFVDYGYLKVTHVLRDKSDMIINPKKVYRLMKAEGLLQKKQRKEKVDKQRADGRKFEVHRPFEKIEIDIKYIYVAGEKRHYYMLNLIDCYSWKLLSYRLSASIKKEDVISLLIKTFALYGFPEEITIRSDNGSQFISKKLAEFVDEFSVTHEFTHVATPQENGHVECFHSIVQRFLDKRGEFNSFLELESVMKKWTEFYNEERPHKGCKYKTPNYVMSQYYKKTGENVGKKSA